MTPAEELRAAAEKLRTMTQAIPLLGVLVHPGVGLTLAEWLDDEAKSHNNWVQRGTGERGRSLRLMFAEERFHHALTFARLINAEDVT